jgi:putative hemolysin
LDNPVGDGYSSHLFILSIFREELTFADWSSFGLAVSGIFILLLFSAFFSASESALLSLGPQAVRGLRERNDRISRTILQLIYEHRKLRATVFIVKSFASVGIIFLSAYIFNTTVFDFSVSGLSGLFFQVVLVTLVLVFFGEVFPRVCAASQHHRIVRIMALPLHFSLRLLRPLLFMLDTAAADKRTGKKGHQISLDDLNHAIDLTTDGEKSGEEKEILKGIVSFGNIPVKQIMLSRMDVMALDSEASFQEVLEKIKEWGYSRIPVYEENFDHVLGILYIKDLIPHLRKPDFNWREVIRAPYFVPESKKLDDLMNEFQEKRVHMAIVADEYGGTSGIVTMEDVLEEIFGEIRDEFDEDDFSYSQLDDYTYVFEGKSLIHDICRITETDQSVFDDARGESDTLGGMLCELEGEIPAIGAHIRFADFDFYIESADKRRIKRVKMVLPKLNEGKEKE